MANQNGRAQAMAYRKSQIGGNASAPKPQVATRAQRKAAPVASAAAPAASPSKGRSKVVNTPSTPVAVGRKAAQERRQQMVSGGRAVSNQTNQQPATNRRMKNKPEETIPTRAQSGSSVPARRQEAPASTASAGRKNKIKQAPATIVQSSGRARSQAYRKAQVQGKVTEQAFRSQGGSSGSVAKATNPGASTREIAQKVRAEKCSKGSCGSKPVSRTRPMRSRPAAPEKVGKSETLSGQSISGTQVGNDKLTGAETGACATVSGTEYLGTEQFAGCATKPEAGTAKVTQTQTTRGQVVSGNRIGNGNGMTGHEAGACSAITGTEYLPADQSSLMCGTPAPAAPVNNARTFSVEATVNNSKVTGGENYVSNSQTIRPKTERAPLTATKVIASATPMGNMVKGTQVGRANDVATGSEAGACSAVTGTNYVGADIFEAICSKKPDPAPAKVTLSGTSGGQTVTGDRSGLFTGLTGAEAGACQAVTGDQYIGSDLQGNVCGTDQRKMQEMRKSIISQNVARPISGTSQPGVDGLTGAQKGACSVVSGTPYVGADQMTMCTSANAAQVGESDFPIMMDGNLPAAQPQTQRFDLDAQDQLEAEAPQSRITGDGWDRSSKVTGTEGQWANSRNMSVKGSSSRQAPMGAAQFRPKSMEEVPVSPITGSSGNAATGAKVTLSGGARA